MNIFVSLNVFYIENGNNTLFTGINPPPNVQWFIGDREIRPDDYDYYDTFRGDNVDFFNQRKYAWSENDQVFHIYNIGKSIILLTS